MGVIADVRAGLRPQSGQGAPLVDLLPGLDRRLGEEDRAVAARLQVPVLTAFAGPFDLEAALLRSRAFALVIVEGMMLRMLGLGEHPGLQMLGPSDVIVRGGASGTDLLARSGLEAPGLVQYAPLDDRVLALARRYPRIIEGLQMRGDAQQQRLLAQLLICQLPRVEDRVLAIMWLLAETWGRVTTSGTLLPVKLTHDAIGLLVGARRSTVTLALKALEDRGALLRRLDDWLILEQPPPATVPPRVPGLPEPVPHLAVSPWTEPSRHAPALSLIDEIEQLRTRREATIGAARAGVAAANAASRQSRRLVEEIDRRRSGPRSRLHHQDDPGDLPVSLSAPER